MLQGHRETCLARVRDGHTDALFAVGEDGHVHSAAPGAPIPEDLAAVQQQGRARVLRWFARADPLDPADLRNMAGWHHSGGFQLRPLRLTLMKRR